MGPVDIEHAAILIRINRLYRPDMTDVELYEATRGQWRIAPMGRDIEFAMALHGGEVKEVYAINSWHPSGTLHYTTRDLMPVDGRWEFQGNVAPEPIRGRYVGGSVAHYFNRGNANPIRYVNC